MEEYILKLLKELKEEIRLADQRIKQLELKVNKGAPNGYAELDANALLPLNRIPATLTGKDADTVDTFHVKIMQVTFPAGQWQDTGQGVQFKDVTVSHNLGVVPKAIIGHVGHTGSTYNRLTWTTAYSINSTSFIARMCKPAGSTVDDIDSIWVIFY